MDLPQLREIMFVKTGAKESMLREGKGGEGGETRKMQRQQR